jgi:hypothetical protein
MIDVSLNDVVSVSPPEPLKMYGSYNGGKYYAEKLKKQYFFSSQFTVGKIDI